MVSAGAGEASVHFGTGSLGEVASEHLELRSVLCAASSSCCGVGVAGLPGASGLRGSTTPGATGAVPGLGTVGRWFCATAPPAATSSAAVSAARQIVDADMTTS